MELTPPFFSLPTFFLFFTTIYLSAYFVIFRNWNTNTRPHASSCLLSLSHGTPAVLLATLSLDLLHPKKTHLTNLNFASPNTPLQNLTLEYSTAYFLTDLLHYLLFVPADYLFILHHAATVYVFLTCRYAAGHGAYPVLVLLVLDEVTSACQNVWTFAGFSRDESPAAEWVYGFLSPLFYSVYSVVRGVIGPVFVWEMGLFYLRGGGEGVIPKWVWVSWMVVIVSAILVSVLWVWNRWVDWCTEKRRKNEMKKKKLG